MKNDVSWQDKENFIGNEVIEIGKNNFVDERGIISNYYFDDSINMLVTLSQKSNNKRKPLQKHHSNSTMLID